MGYYPIALAVLLFSVSAHCDSSSASSGASSSSDGSGSTFTQTSNNGQGTSTSNNHGPANVGGANNNNGFVNPGFANAGFGNPTYQNPGFGNAGFGTNGFTNNFGTHPGYYGPANYNPGNFGGFGTLGNYGNYGPGFNYAPVPNVVPQYQPTAPFGFQAQFAPQPLLTPQEFNQQLSQYLSSLQQQYARVGSGGTFAYSTPGASAYATSYNGPTNLYKRQQDWINTWKDAQSQAYSGSNPNYAYATGAYTPNGIYQTAGVYPPNKNKPNIDSRFEPEDASGKPFKKPNFYGVSTSSFSSSSKGPDGEYHKEGAITAVNDNGKVTIHKIES